MIRRESQPGGLFLSEPRVRLAEIDYSMAETRIAAGMFQAGDFLSMSGGGAYFAPNPMTMRVLGFDLSAPTALVASYIDGDAVRHGMVTTDGYLNGTSYHQGDLVIEVYNPETGRVEWVLKTTEEIMATAARKVPTRMSSIPPSPLPRFARTGTRRIPNAVSVTGPSPEDEKRAKRILTNYSVAQANLEIAKANMAKEATNLQAWMESKGLKEITVDDLVAHFPRKKGNKSREITPEDLWKALDEDEEKFYECVTVALGKLATYMTESEIAAITTEHPGVLKTAEFAIESVDKKTMT